jgi:retron-type reverse transcriptase
MIGLSVDTKADVAKLLCVGPHEIDEVARHIKFFYQPIQRHKADGTTRTLNVPAGQLKLLQQKIKNHILDATGLLDCVHGGVRKRSVITNALPHVRKEVVFTLDIKEFFPSVSSSTVRAIFRVLGFGEEAAAVLTRLVVWEGHLPQGATTSTGVANLAMTRVDIRLRSLARQQGFDYTRYVDDLTLSGSRRLLDFRRLIIRIVGEEGFRVNPCKVRTMHSGMRQVVTGVVVNGKLNLPREERDRIRQNIIRFAATPRRLRRNEDEIRGQLSWLSSVNAPLGKRLKMRIENFQRV